MKCFSAAVFLSTLSSPGAEINRQAAGRPQRNALPGIVAKVAKVNKYIR